jgi:hypothetical protein
VAINDLPQKFLEHYYPYTPTPPQPRNFNDAPGLTGTYQDTRSTYTTALKYLAYFSGLQSPAAGVVGYPNGTFTTTSGLPLNLVEVAPLVFASPDGNAIGGSYHIVFTTGSNGTYFHPDAAPQYFERLPWYATPAGVTNLGYLCLAVFLSAAIWPVGALHGRWRRWRGTRPTETTALTRTRLPSLAHWVMGTTAILYWLVFLIPFLLLIGLGTEGFVYLTASLTIPPPITAWLTLPLIAIVLTVVGVILTVLAWTRRYWTTFGRIHYTVVVGAALTFIIWLSYWNLIGFKW